MELAGELDGLTMRCGHAAAFSRHCFLHANWRIIGKIPRTSLHVVVIRRDGRAVAVAPMVLRRDRTGFSRLEWLNSIVPVYSELLLDPDQPRGTLTKLIKRHFRSLPFVRRLTAERVLDGSSLAHLVSELGAKSTTPVPTFSFKLSACDGWEAFFAAMSSNSRYYYRRHLRELEKFGPVAFEVIDDRSRVERETRRLIDKKRIWVEERHGRTGWIFDPSTPDYLTRTAKSCATARAAWIVTLRCGNRTLAETLNYRLNGVDFPILISQDQQWNDYSPGWLLTMQVFRQAFDDGIDRVDLMRGTTPQKKRMSNETIGIRDYSVYLGLGRLL